MLKKLLGALQDRLMLLTYLVGAATVSTGVGLVFLPAGVIAGGMFLVALVIETGGRS